MLNIPARQMTHIVLWKWTQPNERVSYDSHHVNVMASMINRNVTIPHRVVCVTDQDSGISECETFHLWSDFSNLVNATKAHLPSCYRRLKLYDFKTQQDLGIDRGDRVVSIDLDAVVCGSLDRLLQKEGRFVGWELKGAQHPTVFNGSFQMFTSGDLQEIWSEFNPATSPRECFLKGWLGSDQSWLSMNLIGREGSVAVGWPEVASYPLQVRLAGMYAKTKIMFFHGRIKPWFPQVVKDSPFIDRYWRL